MCAASRGVPRVLVLAEECNPEMVSVPLEGWSHYRALAGVVEAHLVTQVRNRDAIRRAGLEEGKDFTCIDTEAIARPLYLMRPFLGAAGGKGWTIITALQTLQYPYFEKLVWERFGGAIRAGEFDVVHRLVPLSPTAPSLLARECRKVGVPFVMGPLNGGLKWPKAFDRERRREREWLSYARGVYKCMPGYQDTWRNCAAAIVGSRDTWGQVPRQYRGKCVYVPENGIDVSRFGVRRTRRAGEGPVRVVFVGRLVPYKGADMLIEAAAPLVREGTVEVEIIGDGPMRGELEGLVARLGIGGGNMGGSPMPRVGDESQRKAGVKFSGWVEHRELQGRLVGADLFGFPSIREFGGAVVLEAMGVGVPALVVDYGGPGELVTEKTGFLVPMGSREEIVAGVRGHLERIVAEPGLIEERSGAAVRRAREQFAWEAKARQTVEVYEWVMGRRGKPAFAMPLGDLETGETGAERGAAVSGVSGMEGVVVGERDEELVGA